MGIIRACTDRDHDLMLQIINSAAAKYRGAIPDDCWHDPYMPLSQLEAECARGVRFLGYIENERLIGIMGVELVRNVSLIRHAYVAPDYQARGIGKALLLRIVEEQDRQVLVGTWTAATWAIEFYKHHGFRLPSPACQQLLLNSYWCIPKRMADCSVALARPPLSDAQVDALVNQ